MTEYRDLDKYPHIMEKVQDLLKVLYDADAEVGTDHNVMLGSAVEDDRLLFHITCTRKTSKGKCSRSILINADAEGKITNIATPFETYSVQTTQ